MSTRKMEQRQHVDLISHQREGFKHQAKMCFTSRQGGLLIKNHGVKQFDSLTTKNWRLNQQRESNSKSFESLDSILTFLRIETTSKHGDLVIPYFKKSLKQYLGISATQMSSVQNPSIIPWNTGRLFGL
jgi:hypothetical protein